MRMNPLTLLALVAVVAVAVITAGGCSQAQAPVGEQPAAAIDAPAAVAPDTDIPAAPAAPDVPVVDATATDAPAAADLTAETLPGTSWQAGPFKLAFGPDGSLTIDDTTAGSWSVDGQQLTVSGAGTEYKAQIKGDTLYYGDMPLVKIQ